MLTHQKNFKYKKLSLALCASFCLSTFVQADDKGLVENLTGFNINNTSLMQSLGIKLGGWVEFGFAGNIRGSKDGTNGPVTFASRENELDLHQTYGFIEREVDTSSGWDIGFRADLLYGTDAGFTTTRNFDSNILGSNDKLKLALPQAYVDIFMPIGNGITAKVGHFYTIIGYEVVPAEGNFFFTHAYTMQYAEPFTQSGVLLTYPINNNITVVGGVVSGWDSNFKQPANFLGSISYSTDDGGTSITGSLIAGDTRTRGTNDNHNRSMYSIVLTHDVTERLHYVLQHDLGFQESTAFNGGKAQWYGINQYLFYEHTDKLSSGLRVEWFRDDDGVRVGFGDNSYFGVTGGVNYKPIQGITIRPEIRYDVSTNNNAFNGGRNDDQVMVSVSSIFQF